MILKIELVKIFIKRIKKKKNNKEKKKAFGFLNYQSRK